MANNKKTKSKIDKQTKHNISAKPAFKIINPGEKEYSIKKQTSKKQESKPEITLKKEAKAPTKPLIKHQPEKPKKAIAKLKTKKIKEKISPDPISVTKHPRAETRNLKTPASAPNPYEGIADFKQVPAEAEHQNIQVANINPPASEPIVKPEQTAPAQAHNTYAPPIQNNEPAQVIPAAPQTGITQAQQIVEQPIIPIPVAVQKTAADFAPDYEFVITEEDITPPLPVITFNNKSITAGVGHKFKRSGPLTFNQNGMYGDGVTPFYKEIQFADAAGPEDFFNQLVKLELSRSVKKNVAQNMTNKILTIQDIDQLISILPAAPAGEAISKVDPNLASLLQQKNNQLANGQQAPPKVFTTEDFKNQMRSYGKTIYEQICESVQARILGGMPTAMLQADILNKGLKEYKYELRNLGPGYFIEMIHGSDKVRIPENEGEYLPVV